MRSTLTARVAPLILAVSLAVTVLPHSALASMPAHRNNGVLLPHRVAHGVSFQSHPRLSHPRLSRPRVYGLRLSLPRLGRPHFNHPRLRHTSGNHPRLRHARVSHLRLSKRASHPRLSQRGVTKAPALPYMASKIEMLDLINAERAQAGARPLSFDPVLNIVAQWRSQDMITRHYFSHQIPPGGHYVFDTLDRDHVQYEMAGENIALNNYVDFYPLDRTVRQTNTDLMNSPDHRANILEPKYTKIGLGMAFEHGTGKLILTEVFVQP